MNNKNGRKFDNRFYPMGMILTRTLTPHVPVSSSEIIEDVHSAWELGITKVHLNARGLCRTKLI